MSIASHRPSHLAPPIVDDRRSAPRLAQADVPWLRTIRPNISGSATLVNISKTGVLFDTPDRLAPGRRTTLVAAADDQRIERLPAIVVRAYVVSIAEKTGVVYRTALEFEDNLPWDLEIPVPARDQVVAADAAALAQSLGRPDTTGTHTAGELMFAGPVEALFSTDSSSQLVSVSALTETGCIVRTSEPVRTGAWVSIATFFAGSQGPLLTGRVTSIAGDGCCVVRFVNLSAGERDLLRMMLRRAALQDGQALDVKTGVRADGQVLSGGSLGLKMASRMVTVHAAQW